MKKRVLEGDIVVGRPLDYDVRDRNNNLLLRKGYIITRQSQIEILTNRGLYFVSSKFPAGRSKPCDDAAGPAEGGTLKSSFEIIEEVYLALSSFYNLRDACETLEHNIRRLAEMIQQACEIDKDASLSTILWPPEIRYSIKHQIDTTIACEVVLKKLEYTREERTSVLAGALTMNIAMIDLQDVLFYQRDELSEDQRKRVREHVREGVEILQTSAVTDRIWLDVVAQHHELLDGSGYPGGLKGDEIREPARILTIGDIYCAKVTGRSYRTPLPPHKAIGEVYCNERGLCIDVALARLFATEFGIYPPGSFVRLANGDVAVVTRTGSRLNQPTACSIVKADGKAYMSPLARDTGKEEFAVKDIIPRSEAPSIDRYRLWCT